MTCHNGKMHHPTIIAPVMSDRRLLSLIGVSGFVDPANKESLVMLNLLCRTPLWCFYYVCLDVQVFAHG